MARDFSQVLQQAMEFYVAGQFVEARALLLDIVRADPTLEAGWMFLSYVLDEPVQKADCLRKVLAINPENAEAKTALAQMLGASPSEPPAAAAKATAPVMPPPALAAVPAPKKPPATEQVSAAPAVTSSKPPSETAPAAQTAAAPAISAAPTLVHASPFTVDIDYANDESAVISEPVLPAPGAQEERPAQPPIKPFPPQSVSRVQKTGTSPLPGQRPAPSAGAGAQIPAPERKTGQLAQPAGEPPVKRTGQLAQPAGQPPVRKTGQLAQPAGQPPVRKTGQLAQPEGKSPARKTGQLAPAAVKESPPPKKRSAGCTCLVVIMILALIAAGIGVGLYLTGNLPDVLIGGNNSAVTGPAVAADTPTPFNLPPRATDTPTPTLTRTATISPTPTQTLTPTLAHPDATTQADMNRLMEEVEDIRGLTMQSTVPAYIVDRSQAESILQNEYDRIGYREIIQNEAKAMAALGFIKPTYDMAKYALTRLADGVMGFYMPANPAIYIIGNRFAGMERWTFTHEFDHALVHSHFSAVGIMEDDPICANDSQRCEAIRALVEGDAMLVMAFWREQYASAYDERDIALYPYPFLLPLEQNTPPYITPMIEFSYYGGLIFVYSLWEKGNWAEVNKAYEELPVSTEQILHPQKYLDGEKPATMRIPDLGPVLGPDWSLVKSDSLGEFMSYLLLTYNADVTSQISSDTAETATSGWGGDHYLVLSSSDGEKLVLASEWNWDTDADAAQFYAAIQEYVDKRFRGETTPSSSGFCWAVNKETTCLFRSGRNILWVLAPDLDVVTRIRSAYRIY